MVPCECVCVWGDNPEAHLVAQFLPLDLDFHGGANFLCPAEELLLTRHRLAG